jgi:hypothetical protein
MWVTLNKQLLCTKGRVTLVTFLYQQSKMWFLPPKWEPEILAIQAQKYSQYKKSIWRWAPFVNCAVVHTNNILYTYIEFTNDLQIFMLLLIDKHICMLYCVHWTSHSSLLSLLSSLSLSLSTVSELGHLFLSNDHWNDVHFIIPGGHYLIIHWLSLSFCCQYDKFILYPKFRILINEN